MSSGVEIRIASNDADRRSALRIRYEVFCEEKNDRRYAVEGEGICHDDLDTENARYVMAVVGGQCVGSSRISLRRIGPFIRDDRYRWDELSSVLQVPVPSLWEFTALWDRGAILHDFRRAGIFKRMESFVVQSAADFGCRYAVGTVRADNVEMMAFMKSRDWQIWYAEQLDGVEWTQQFKCIAR